MTNNMLKVISKDVSGSCSKLNPTEKVIVEYRYSVSEKGKREISAICQNFQNCDIYDCIHQKDIPINVTTRDYFIPYR